MWIGTVEGAQLDEAAPFFNADWFNAVDEDCIIEGDVISKDGTINLHVAAATYKPEWGTDGKREFYDPTTDVEYRFEYNEGTGYRSLSVII